MDLNKNYHSKFSITLIFIIIIIIPSVRTAPKELPIIKNWEGYFEMSKFITYSIQKFGSSADSLRKCHTIIWERELSFVVDNVNLCNEDLCSTKFLIEFNGNYSSNFTSALKASYTSQCASYVILLSKTSSIIDLVRKGDENRTLNTRGKFLIWYGEESKSFENAEIWKKLPNVVFFHAKLKRRPTRNRKTSFKIMSLKWPIMPNSSDSVRVIDFWRNGRLAKDEDNWYRDKTGDLRNATLKILTVEHPPSVIKYRSRDGQVEYAGTEIELIKELSLIMNFNFEFVDADPLTKWGGVITSENKSQSFYGAVARLIYEEVDLAIGSFIVLKKNLEFIDMSLPLDVACSSFLTPNPLPRPRYLAMILPFQFNLWALVITITMIFAPLAFFFMARLPNHLHDGRKEYKLFSTKWHSIFTSISILSQVALALWPKLWPMRMLIGWYWIFTLLITLAYRAAMVSFLTIPLFDRAIDNLRDLSASGLRIGGWGPELKTLFTHQIQSDNVETDRARQRLSDIYELVDDYNTGISLVAGREFALYENIRYLKFIAKTRNLTKVGSPSMRVMKQCILPLHIGIAYQKNSPISHNIDANIQRFQESGLMRKWSQRLISKTKQFNREQEESVGVDTETSESSPQTSDDEGNDDNEDSETEEAQLDAASSSKQRRKQRVLSMKDLQGASYLIIFGMALSILVFIIEFFINHLKIRHHLTHPTKPSANIVLNLDLFTKITEKTLKMKTQRELNSILREMGLMPKRKDEIKGGVMRKWRKIKNYFAHRNVPLFPYIE